MKFLKWEKLSWRKGEEFCIQASSPLGFFLSVCIRVLGFEELGRIYELNYHGFIAGSKWTISGCEMSSLWYGCLESEVVKWSGRLPQLQSHREEKDLMKLSKDYKERLEQQTFLCPVVKAFLTLIRCGIHCEYSVLQSLFPNVIFHSGVCVYVSVIYCGI